MRYLQLPAHDENFTLCSSTIRGVRLTAFFLVIAQLKTGKTFLLKGLHLRQNLPN